LAPNSRQPSEEGGPLAASAWLRAVQRWQQRAHQQQGMRQRRQLLEQDLSWQQRFDVTRLRA
jgi:hypothetical protein